MTADIDCQNNNLITQVAEHDFHGKTNEGLDGLRYYTYEEVRRHDKPSDCWMVIHGKVYDVGPIMSIHPGGSQILLKYAGMDATFPFDDVGHSMESLLYDMPQGSLKGYVLETNALKGKCRKFEDSQAICTEKSRSDEKDTVIIGRGQSLDGYLIWNKMYTFLLCVAIFFCLCALLYMKLYDNMMTMENMSIQVQKDRTSSSFTSNQEQVSDTDAIPDWAY